MPQGLSLVKTGKTNRPFAPGGLSDTWKPRNDDEQIFTIKHLRTYETDDLTYEKGTPRLLYSIRHLSRGSVPRNTVKRSPSTD
jgi:hypothetical protein